MLGLVQDGADARAVGQNYDSFEQKYEKEWGARASGDPVDGRRDHQEGEKKCCPAHGPAGKLEGCLRPGRERIGVDGGGRRLAGDCHRLAEVEAVAEVGDGLVTQIDGFDRGWVEEPVGQGVFAHTGAGEGEELEQAAMAEEIEVGGVEMIGDVEALATSADAAPFVFDTRKALAVELGAALGYRLQIKDFGVEDGYSNEQEDGHR